MFNYMTVALGSLIGGTLRFGLSGLVENWLGAAFPWGTLIINVTGSFAIGLFAALTGPDGRWLVPLPWRQFFMVGVCGGYTTFSSFSLQTLALTQDGEWLGAGLNILMSVAFCLAAVWAGHVCAGVLNH
jgi:CrcB protein